MLPEELRYDNHNRTVIKMEDAPGTELFESLTSLTRTLTLTLPILLTPLT